MWPQAVTTDGQGRFTLAGIGRGLTADIEIRDPRFAQQVLQFQTDGPDASKEATISLQPAKTIEGRVLAADTGGPIGDAVIAVRAQFSEFQYSGSGSTRFRADDRGRFTANPSPGDLFHLDTHPPDGQPYLVSQVEFAWTKGAIKEVIDLRLARGVLIHGSVTERGTGRPLTGASVQYIPARNPGNVLSGWDADVVSKDNGTYQIAVPPGTGCLFVYGPTSDYILETIGRRMIHSGEPGGDPPLRARHHPLQGQGG